MPVLAAASSCVGERQGGVKNVETMMVVRVGMVGQAGKHASNRGSGASQSASAACQHAWTNAVTA